MDAPSGQRRRRRHGGARAEPVAIVAHALVRPKSRLIVWIHAEVVRPQWRYKVFYRPFLRRLLTLADRIVVASPPMIDVAEELKDFRAKAVVIPHAIDPDQHTHDPNICERARRIRAEHQSRSCCSWDEWCRIRASTSCCARCPA
jgi:glycosyltransferase involved in cell wall biosynthesis